MRGEAIHGLADTGCPAFAGIGRRCNGTHAIRFADMETESQENPIGTPEAEPGRLERLAAEVRGLVEDVRTWIDLKIKLLEIEVEERVRDLLNRVAVTVVIAVLAFLALVFVLVTAALALGLWWDNMLLGFVAVTLALVVLTIMLYVLRPGLVRKREAARREDLAAVGPAVEPARLEAATEEDRDG